MALHTASMTQFPVPFSQSGKASLSKGMTVSIVLHVALIAGFVFWKGMAPAARPPQYRIELIGAAGLKKQMGIVAPQTPAPEAPKPVEARAAERPPEPPKKVNTTKAKAEPKPIKATPNPTPVKATPKAVDAPKTEPTKAAPVAAGSGQTKARGTDVTNMVVEGIEFPFPGYLTNMARRIMLRFDWQGAPYVSEVRFVIHRDGSITGIRVLTSSGNRTFDLEGQGAVEAVGNARELGRLPDAFSGDSLPVYFTFKPPEKP